MALLVEFIDAHADQLCEECLERRRTNPLRVLDCKNRDCQTVLAAAPRITDHLCDPCREHFAEVCRHLDARGVAYELVPTLVRGLDYYTRTTWEWSGAGLASATGVSRLFESSRATPVITRPPSPFGVAGTVAVRSTPSRPGRGRT